MLKLKKLLLIPHLLPRLSWYVRTIKGKILSATTNHTVSSVTGKATLAVSYVSFGNTGKCQYDTKRTSNGYIN